MCGEGIRGEENNLIPKSPYGEDKRASKLLRGEGARQRMGVWPLNLPMAIKFMEVLLKAKGNI